MLPLDSEEEYLAGVRRIKWIVEYCRHRRGFFCLDSEIGGSEAACTKPRPDKGMDWAKPSPVVPLDVSRAEEERGELGRLCMLEPSSRRGNPPNGRSLRPE